MSDNNEEPQQERQFVQGPRLTEREMDVKLDQMRTSVAKKLNSWADKVQVSYSFTPQVERVDGERWKENGKSYLMKGGIKQSVNPLHDAKMPWWCPECKKPMNHRFDKKFFYIRGWCFDCNIEFEGKLRLEGKWEAYEKRILRENEKAMLRDDITQRIEYIKNFKVPQIHFEDGRWEELASIREFSGLFEELEKEIELCQNRLTQIQQEEEDEACSTK